MVTMVECFNELLDSLRCFAAVTIGSSGDSRILSSLFIMSLVVPLSAFLKLIFCLTFIFLFCSSSLMA